LSVAGISYSTDEPSLREAFSRYGEVLDGKYSLTQCFLFVMYTFLSNYCNCFLFGNNLFNVTLFVARIIMDRESGRSRGFGFITFNSVEEASSAIQALDGQVI